MVASRAYAIIRMGCMHPDARACRPSATGRMHAKRRLHRQEEQQAQRGGGRAAAAAGGWVGSTCCSQAHEEAEVGDEAHA